MLNVDAEGRPSSEQILRVPALQPTVASYVQRVARERGTGIDSPRVTAPTPANTPTNSAENTPESSPSEIRVPATVDTPSAKNIKPKPKGSRMRQKPRLSVRSENTPSPNSPHVAKTKIAVFKKNPTPTSQKGKRTKVEDDKENVRIHFRNLS